jgi:uncharacterized protein YggL (DUF469 family)
MTEIGNKQYFDQIMKKFNNMSDEEFHNFIDPVIEQTELIGGLTTNIRADILMLVMEYEYKIWLNEFKNKYETLISSPRGKTSTVIFYDECRELNEENEKIVKEYLTRKEGD